MELKEGKKYYVRINVKKDSFYSLRRASEKIKGKPILVYYSGKFFRIIDKRLKGFSCFDGDFYLSRFIIEENLQLELDF